MKKKKKLNKKKFISRMILLIIVLIVIIFLIKGIFKKEKYDFEKLTLVIDNENLTEKLISDIYIDKDGILYMSMEDIKNIFDNNLYYEEATGKIITTSGTKVAAIDINNNTLEVNSATLLLSAGIIKYDTGYYIPLSEITNVYNIEIVTTENSGVVSSLYKELTTVKTTKKVSLKENTSIFSGTLQRLEEGKEVILIENSEKAGWIKVLTYEGKIGYIKEKNVGDKNFKRINMEESDFSSKNADIENSIEITNKTLTDDNLKDFTSRKKVVEDIVSKVISKEKYTVNLNLRGVENEKIERLVVELIPRLKEIGGSLVITNNNILSNEFINENNL